MQGQPCFTSRQRPFDSCQKIFPTKRCWRIVAVLTGLVCLAMSPYTHSEQTSAEMGQSTAEGGTANKPLRKLSPKQFCVDVEIPGKYSISILFDIGFSTNESSKDYQPEINKFMEREREVLTLLKMKLKVKLMFVELRMINLFEK